MKRVICTFLAAVWVLLSTSEVEARTLPRRGAASKPMRFVIQEPFPCGVKMRISCAYGPDCSPAHKRVHSPGATNDHYALDMTRSLDGNGQDLPIVAIAPGVVRMAGWAKGGWAPYGILVYIEHFFRDRQGKRYQSLYGHLQRVTVQPGQRVEAGTVIGTLGGSSKGRQMHFGPHLHFAMYRGAKSTLGGGQAVVPEPMGKQEDLHARMTWVACQNEPAVAMDDTFDPTTAAGGLEPAPESRSRKPSE